MGLATQSPAGGHREEGDREFLLTQDDFVAFAEEAYRRSGIRLESKRELVYRRLAKRLRALSFTSFTEYRDFLNSPGGGDEFQNFINSLTTNHTKFFRENHHFEHMAKHVIAPYSAGKGDRRLRIWSAACSSGEEPYSIAMAALRASSRIAHSDFRILATDIDSNILQTAKEGIYDTSRIDAAEFGVKRFVERKRDSDAVRIRKEVRDLIVFKQLNLLEAWPMKGPFDVVFCRNVMIYFDAPTKKRLMDRMAKALKPGGWLYIGHSESLAASPGLFEAAGRTTYKRL